MARFGIVKFVMGMVKAVSSNGVERALHAGDKVLPEEVIVTADNGNIVIEFNNGTTMDLGRNQQVTLNEDALVPENPAAQAGVQTAAGAQSEVAAIQQALFDENFDPTKALKATAAGGADAGGGTAPSGNEGHGTVYVVDYNDPMSQPASGFDTTGISFSFPPPLEVLILNPQQLPADNPAIIKDLTPSVEGGDVTANEDDLQGGSDPTKESTTQAGNFTIKAADGVGSLTVEGQTVIEDGVFNPADPGNPVIINSPYGTLIIQSYNPATGVIEYTYTLNTPVPHASGEGNNSFFDNFTAVLTDGDGDSNTGILSVNIIDDVPIAVNDADSIAAGSFEQATGNVITDAEGDGGADTRGADGAQVTAVASDNVPVNSDNTVDGDGNFEVVGQYGILILNQDGSYNYSRNEGTPGGVFDVFTYTLTDGDGDNATATLTIAVGNTPPIISDLTPQAQGGDVSVDEGNLADGSSSNAEALTQSGSFSINSPDGIDSLTIGGHTFISEGVFTAGSFQTDFGNTLTITSYDPDTGVVNYTYTLNDNETHAEVQGNNSLFEDFAVVLTDQGGESVSDTLSVNIVDDVPTAVNDTDSIAAGSFVSATGNVITDAEGDGGADTRGADGAQVTAVASNNVPANSDNTADGGGNFEVAGQYGILTLNQDGSYLYTRNDGTPGGVNDVFTYTLTDGDGDSATATLTIAIGNTPPTLSDLTPQAQGGDVSVYEDDLADGSSSNVEALTQSGSFTISSPDGLDSLTIGGHTFISESVFTAGSFQTGFGNTLTITSYDPDTGVVNYTYALNDNETHANVQGNNSLFEGFSVVLTDQDGQSVSDTLSVNIVDDVPTAVNDMDSIAAGTFVSATGNVITDAAAGDAGDSDTGADTRGADGAQVTAVASNNVPANSDNTADSGGNFEIAGQYGILTLNQDGSYIYTRNDGSPGGVNDVFTYTLTDGDGDNAAATLTITIGNTPPTLSDLTPQAQGGDVSVYEDDLADGSDPVPKDNLTQEGSFAISSPDGIDSLTIGGHAFISEGAFTAGSFQTALGNTLTVIGYDANTGVVSYSYTLNDNEAHANVQGNNSLFEGFSVVLTDQDGQSVSDTLSVNIVDDVPSINVAVINEAGGVLATQDAETDGDPTDTDIAVSSANFGGVFGVTSVSGADGATTSVSYALSLAQADGIDSGLNSHGADIHLYLVDGEVVGSTALSAVSVTAVNTIFSIATNSSGEVTLSQFQQIDHVGGAGAISLGDNLVNLTATATITDFDGDTATDSETIDLGGGNIRFDDDMPTVISNAQLTGTVDEDGVSGGIAGGAYDVHGEVVVASGNVASLFNSGADTPLNFVLAADTATMLQALNLSSGGAALSYIVNGDTVTASANGATIFTFQLTNNGTYTFTLQGPLDHPTLDGKYGDNTENDLALNLGGIITAVDFDGDTVTANNTSLIITIDDDTPVNFFTEDGAVLDTNIAPTTFDLNLSGTLGADGLDGVVFDIANNGMAATDAAGNLLSFNGQQIYLYGDGSGTLIGSTSSASPTAEGAVTVFTITLNPGSDTYSVDLNGTISNGTEVSISNLTSAGAGNTDFRSIGVDNPNNAVDILLTGRGSNGLQDTINTDSDSIGVDGGQAVDANEAVRIDFLSNLTTAPANPSGLAYSGHVSATSFQQKIAQVQGPQSNTVTIVVTALLADNDQEFDITPSTLEAGESKADITSVRVFDAGGVDVTALFADGDLNNGNIGIVDGVATISGLQEGYQYEINTTSPFSAVVVESPDTNTYGFDLGVFSLQTVNDQTPIDLSYNLLSTDYDGDTASGSLDLSLLPNNPDTQIGTEGVNDVLTGDGNNNSLAGLGGDDTLNGLGGNDYLFGGDGKDILNGGDGNDILIGGVGSDTMTGGAGSDVFKYSGGDLSGGGVDQITDFNFNAPASGGDVLDISDVLSGFGGTTVTDAVAQGFVQFANDGSGHTAVQVDADGTAGGTSFQTVAVLQNVAFTDANAALTQLQDNITVQQQP
ncbi:retention module-containing protein [Methylomicrobium lacus]|uniref:retention module-containing protein n=1 Tax=Methylomicrobium lacus TaxID=136992 RepID=UPI0035A90AA9